jgi:serine protease
MRQIRLRHLTAIALASVFALPASALAAGETVPGQLIVGYSHSTDPATQDAIATAAGTQPGDQVSPHSQVVQLKPGESTETAIDRLRHTPGVRYAVADVIAHAAGGAPSNWLPNDWGTVGIAAGWRVGQWNFLSNSGVDAPRAWANAAANGRAGGRRVMIAVIDSGIAYRSWKRFRRSPDFAGTRFAYGYDFLYNNRFPLDRNGHGTHVAGTIAEATNNRIAMTGLAYAATIMPLRVLDAWGAGDSSAIARAIRYAANRHAQVINLSIEFPSWTKPTQIPDVISAIDYATSKGSLVVAAAGNDGLGSVTYPARVDSAIAVGASTQNGCLAAYSNYGIGLDILAPGGGGDANVAGDSSCHPNDPPGRDILQVGVQRGFTGAASVPYRFELDAEEGTSMATPHVAAAAALVIASGVLGAHPTVNQVRQRLLDSATQKGFPNAYGAGLLNAGLATSPNG